jgi:hypothetical protein
MIAPRRLRRRPSPGALRCSRRCTVVDPVPRAGRRPHVVDRQPLYRSSMRRTWSCHRARPACSMPRCLDGNAQRSRIARCGASAARLEQHQIPTRQHGPDEVRQSRHRGLLHHRTGAKEPGHCLAATAGPTARAESASGAPAHRTVVVLGDLDEVRADGPNSPIGITRRLAPHRLCEHWYCAGRA